MLEQLPGLRGREPQLSRAHLGQLTAGPQPRQPQRRIAAAGQYHAYPGRPVLDQERKRLVHLLRVDHVVVVEDKQGLLPGQIVDQRRDQALERSRRWRAEQRSHPFAGPRTGPVQRGYRVAPEPGRVVVPRVQREPGDRVLAVPGPVGEQDRLAVSSRGGGQDEPPRQALIEPRRQPRPWHLAGARPRQVQLGGEQDIRPPGCHWRLNHHWPARCAPPRSSRSLLEGTLDSRPAAFQGNGSAIPLPWPACRPPVSPDLRPQSTLRRPDHDTDEQERQPLSAADQVPLTDGGRDLDNYLFPIAQRPRPRRGAATSAARPMGRHGSQWARAQSEPAAASQLTRAPARRSRTGTHAGRGTRQAGPHPDAPARRQGPRPTRTGESVRVAAGTLARTEPLGIGDLISYRNNGKGCAVIADNVSCGAHVIT